MAEHTHSGPAELGAPMDYPEHERTYRSFLALTKLGILATIVTLMALILFAFGGGGGFWLGVLMIILTAVALAIGFAMKGSAKPLAIVAALGVLFVAISVG